MQEFPVARDQDQDRHAPSANDPERLPPHDQRFTHHAVFLLAPDGRIRNWSLGAQHLTGYTAHTAIGQPYARLHTEEERQAGRPSELLHVAQESGHLEDSGWRLREDGTRFWADVEITALAAQAGGAGGFAVAMRAATDRAPRASDTHDSSGLFATLVDSIKD